MATVISKEEADAHPDGVLARAWGGEEIFIEQHGTPKRLRLVAEQAATSGRRRPGTLKGIVSVPPSFWESLPEDELRAWEFR